MQYTHVNACRHCATPFQANSLSETIGGNKYCLTCADKLYSTYEMTKAQEQLYLAAPELLEALKVARDTVKTWHDVKRMSEGDNQRMWNLYQHSPEMKKINKAIAKATGEP